MVSLKSIPASFGLIVAVLLGCAVGRFLEPGATSTYLELQATSDTVHRFTLVTLPLVIVFAIISSVLAYRLHNRFRKILVGLSVVCLALGSGLLTYTLSFDASLETHGLEGLFEFPADVFAPASRETGNILVFGNTLLWFGRGHYEDDAQLRAVDLASGRVRWSYHCLGNRVFPPVVEGNDLAFVAWRPATSAVVLIQWHAPRLMWVFRSDTPLVLPPRFTPSGIEVATHDEVLLLARSTGQILKRESACEHPEAVGVACQAGQVVSWIDTEAP